MHHDTYAMLKRAADSRRAHIKEMFPSSALGPATELAQAENLLADHEAAEHAAKVALLPSRWAHVHEVDSHSITGIVSRIPGGLRVEWLDVDVPDDATEPTPRIRDIYAISRVDWITADEYRAHAEMTRSMVADRIKQRLRNSTLPEGYEIVEREVTSAMKFGVRRKSDGLVYGYWSSTNPPRDAAWEAFDGCSEYDWRVPADPVKPCAEISVPF